MDEYRRDRPGPWAPLICSLILALGMVIGFNLRDTLRNKRDIVRVIQRNDRIEEIIDLVKARYVDTVSSDVLYRDAVSGILSSLDPHTVYIPAEDLQAVNDNLEGSFSGIGVEFSIVRDTIEVTGVIENGPAGQAGVEVGDQLIKVNDSIVAGTHITSEHIIHLLRGRQRSSVYITLKRASNGLLRQIPITRDKVPVYSVDAAIMLDSVTAYIKINRFSATTYNEFSGAIDKLLTSGAQRLIIDLRDNPGGYLDAATSILDDLLDGNRLIVYTKGAHTVRAEYKAGDKGAFEKGRLAVLVDERSASASEVLAGAVQDWDRGIIVGRRTFGKGLVQEQYDMPDGSAVRLTIAKYYTPSGRCIQRSYAGGKEAYMEEYQQRLERGELTGNDSLAVGDTVPYYTANKRVVYGGGGIKPDVYVPYDTARISIALMDIIYSQEFKTAVRDYFVRNRISFHYKDITHFIRSFNAQEQVRATYLLALDDSRRLAAMKILTRPVANEYFNLQVKAFVARYLYHDAGYYAVITKDDDVVGRAISIMNSDRYLQIISGK